jgi:hypothetical protein
MGMQLIAHRRNTLAQLVETPPQYGIEVDIRSWGDELIIHHDAFLTPDHPEVTRFNHWLQAYQHKTLILNVKEEGLEARLIQLMVDYGITDYFFLDQSFPFLIKWVNQGEHRAAVRVSEFESLDTAMTLAGKVDWVWVDCFTRFPLTGEQARQLQQAGFKLCLVSPELQGRTADEAIHAFQQQLLTQGITAEAVCTKRTDLWQPFADRQPVQQTPSLVGLMGC